MTEVAMRDAAFEIDRANKLARRIQAVEAQVGVDREESQALEESLARIAREQPPADLRSSLDEFFGLETPRATVARVASTSMRTAFVRV
jgi:hypothetical protein